MSEQPFTQHLVDQLAEIERESKLDPARMDRIRQAVQGQINLAEQILANADHVVDLLHNPEHALSRERFLAAIETAERFLANAIVEPIVVKENSRLANLPTAEKQYARWREIAEEIRKAKPYIKSKSEIARHVRRRLVNSHDERDQEFVKTIRAIRDKI